MPTSCTLPAAVGQFSVTQEATSRTNRGHPESILITGASSGIGRALAIRFAARGVKLHLIARHRERLHAVASACQERGATTMPVIADVRDVDAMQNAVDQAHTAAPLDLVIANAGITGGTGPDRPLETVADCDLVIRTNLMGVLNTLLPAARIMVEQRSGQIAIISSLAGLHGLPYSPAYSASKAAILAYATAMRPSLRRHGVGVSLVLPGFVETPLDDRIRAPKPFRMSADKAADRIFRGLRRRKERIAFPLPLYLGTLLLRRMPARWADRLLSRIVVEVPPPTDGTANG